MVYSWYFHSPVMTTSMSPKFGGWWTPPAPPVKSPRTAMAVSLKAPTRVKLACKDRVLTLMPQDKLAQFCLAYLSHTLHSHPLSSSMYLSQTLQLLPPAHPPRTDQEPGQCHDADHC